MSVFKGGSTVPVKFQLQNVNGTSVESSSAPLFLAPERLTPMNESTEGVSFAEPATSDTTYRYDETDQQYIYNWSTKGLDKGYWYRLFAKLQDGTTQSVVVGVR